MRTTEFAGAFKRDIKRVRKQPEHSRDLDYLLEIVLDELINDRDLPVARKDHGLTGPWHGFRDCHVKPDLVLIYEKVDKIDFRTERRTPHLLRLARLGSHSELF